MNPKRQHSNGGGDGSSDAGLYTWDLNTDTAYADSALAALFGIDKTLAEHGLPLQSYLDRVHADDRPALAGAIRKAILTGEPFQESYRVHNADGEITRILGLGRCFRDTNEQPRFYAGIVFPMPEERTGEDGLLWQCLSALEMAKRDGRNDVSALLAEAVRKLSGQSPAPFLSLAC
ncbi:PAS domain-containing protein [Rhizobium sp.]